MERRIIADLHNHTTASDGELTPEEIVRKAKILNLKAIGITDHDTINGVKPALRAGQKEGVQVIPGVEISIRFKEPGFTGTLHLLCYFQRARCEDRSFLDEVNAVLSQGRGEKLVRSRVKEINRYFGPKSKDPVLKKELTFEHIASLSDNASRRHFALALNQSFGIDSPETVSRIIGNSSPAYLPSGIDFKTAVAAVSDLDLFSVLAHPAAGSFPGQGHYKEVLPPVEMVETFLPRFLESGLKGLEVYYPGHTKEHQQLMLSWAEKYGLTITGGSDCHDDIVRPPGLAGLDESEFHRFLTALT